MSTIHKSKGLENDNVFVLCPSIIDGIIGRSENAEEKSQEKNLKYVAYTRAMKKLYLTYNTGFDFQTSNNKVQSRFLLESKDYLRFANNASTVSVNNRPLKKPVEEVKVNMPEWIAILNPNHYLKKEYKKRNSKRYK